MPALLAGLALGCCSKSADAKAAAKKALALFSHRGIDLKRLVASAAPCLTAAAAQEILRSCAQASSKAQKKDATAAERTLARAAASQAAALAHDDEP